MLKVGLTGGIACGKSAVAAEFARLNVDITDADAISHSLTAPGQPGLVALCSELGKSILSDDGELNRPGLRRRMVTDADVRRRVEAILHPLILKELAHQLASMHSAYGLAVIPLLVETAAARALVDRVLVVDCPEPQQLSRLMSRDGLSAADARALIALQAGRQRHLSAGDDILGNAGEAAALRNAVARMHYFYLELVASHDYHRAGLHLP